MKNFLLLFVLTLGMWLLLVGNLAMAEVQTGVLVALLVSALTVKNSQLLDNLKLTPMAFWSFLLYLIVFLKALVIANFDMARRVLSRRIPLQPNLVEITTSIQSDLGKLILANSITLTPGTMSVDVRRNRLLVHWIDCPETLSAEQMTQQIAGDFEKHILGFVK